MTNISLIAVDWGTTSFRLWALDVNHRVIETVVGPQGMSTLQPHEFRQVLEENLAALKVGPTVPVVVCGMAGAAQGWFEAPYLSAPTSLASIGTEVIKVPGSNRDVYILPGIKQIHPAQVMRGEETQIAGLLQSDPRFEGTVCLPGTHTKWARVVDGCLAEFTTAMTGELFALLSQSSVLKHSMAEQGWDPESFGAAVKETLDAPQTIATRLFGLRAEMLIGDLSSAMATSQLSGMLIGIELAATRAYWQDNSVGLIGASALCAKYQMALEAEGVDVTVLDNKALTLAGLVNAAERIPLLKRSVLEPL